MARFDRKVERNKSGYQFTAKKVETVHRFAIFKANFGIAWMPKKWSTLGIVFANFLLSTIIFIPLLMRYYNRNIALILGHGVITSLLILLSFYLIADKNQKPNLIELCIRYCFLAIILGAFAVLAVMVV